MPSIIAKPVKYSSHNSLTCLCRFVHAVNSKTVIPSTVFWQVGFCLLKGTFLLHFLFLCESTTFLFTIDPFRFVKAYSSCKQVGLPSHIWPRFYIEYNHNSFWSHTKNEHTGWSLYTEGHFFNFLAKVSSIILRKKIIHLKKSNSPKQAVRALVFQWYVTKWRARDDLIPNMYWTKLFTWEIVYLKMGNFTVADSPKLNSLIVLIRFLFCFVFCCLNWFNDWHLCQSGKLIY